jgi:hypothetical protein
MQSRRSQLLYILPYLRKFPLLIFYICINYIMNSESLGYVTFASIVCIACFFLESRSSGSIVPGYGLDDRGDRGSVPDKGKEFSSSLCVQTGSGAHPASCTMGTGGPFPRGKTRPESDADNSPHLMPRSWMSRSYTSFPPSAFMACIA